MIKLVSERRRQPTVQILVRDGRSIVILLVLPRAHAAGGHLQKSIATVVFSVAIL